MILQDVSDDAKLVKVAATALGAEWLLERDHDGGDVVAIPNVAEDEVPEAKGHEVLHHLLAQVVVDAVELVLPEEGGQVRRQLLGRVEVLAEGLLDDDAGPARGRHASGLDHAGHRLEDGRRQCEVEQAVAVARQLLLDPGHLLVEDLKVPLGVVAPGHVRVALPELLDLGLLALFDLKIGKINKCKVKTCLHSLPKLKLLSLI